LPIEHQLKAEPGEQDQHSSLVRPASIYPVNSFFTFVNWPWRALSTVWFEMPPKKATILPPTNDYCPYCPWRAFMLKFMSTTREMRLTTYDDYYDDMPELLEYEEPFDLRNRNRNRRRVILGGG
jgi:hypothetical protein